MRMKRKLVIILALLGLNNVFAVPQYYCTAANELFYDRLLNLIGSIHRTNYQNLYEIAVFDLGLNQKMVDQLKVIDKVKVYKIKDKNPNLLHVIRWFAWKPAIIKDSLEMFPYVLWLDAGTTVLQQLDRLFEYIQKSGYFLCTVGDETALFGDTEVFKHSIDWQTTKFVREQFHLETPENRWILSKEAVMGGVVGASKTTSFIQDWYQLTKDIRYFADDGTAPGAGRHDQALLSILAYQQNLKIHLQDWTQKLPILLSIGKKDIPFYITWNKNAVCEKTCIYNSRNDLSYFKINVSAIQLHYPNETDQK